MASLSCSFYLSLIPQDKHAAFVARFTDLVNEYQMLTAPVPESPPAESLPMPAFDEPVSEPVVVKPLEKMNCQELRDTYSLLVGKPTGRRTTPKFPTKQDLITEILRLRGAAAAPAAAEVPVAPAVFAEDSLSGSNPAGGDASSETSSKKQRKSAWADLTPEARAEWIAKMKAGREAKKAAREADGSA